MVTGSDPTNQNFYYFQNVCYWVLWLLLHYYIFLLGVTHRVKILSTLNFSDTAFKIRTVPYLFLHHLQECLFSTFYQISYSELKWFLSFHCQSNTYSHGRHVVALISTENLPWRKLHLFEDLLPHIITVCISSADSSIATSYTCTSAMLISVARN